MIFTKAQVQANARHTRGFLGALVALIGTVLASTAARAALPAISHVMSKKSRVLKKEDKCLILHTNDGQCVKVIPEINGDGVWLRPYGRIRAAESHYMRKNGSGCGTEPLLFFQ